MSKYKVKDWEKFQHFKDGSRSILWIKLYKDLLNDIEWFNLDPASAKALIGIWLVASENNGELPSMRELAFRLRMTEKSLESTLTNLSHFLLQDDINLISDGYQVDTLEKSKSKRREEERESADIRKSDALATRLPADWEPSKSDVEFLVGNRPELDLQETKFRFKDYWAAQPGQKGRKLDWSATWRNWVRNERAPAKQSTKVQDARLEVADFIFGRNRNGTDSKVIDITPVREVESRGEDFPAIGNSIREPVDVEVAGDSDGVGFL